MKKAFVLFLFISLAAVIPSSAQQQGPGTFVSPEAAQKIIKKVGEAKKGVTQQAPYPGVHVPNQPQQNQQTQKDAQQQKKQEKTAAEQKKQEKAKPRQHKKKASSRDLLWKGTDLRSTQGRTFNVKDESVKTFQRTVAPVGEMMHVNKLSAEIQHAIFSSYQNAI